jgi:hypothetical protein
MNGGVKEGRVGGRVGGKVEAVDLIVKIGGRMTSHENPCTYERDQLDKENIGTMTYHRMRHSLLIGKVTTAMYHQRAQGLKWKRSAGRGHGEKHRTTVFEMMHNIPFGHLFIP